MNLVRAQMVERPEERHRSSYRVNARAERSPLVAPHPIYLSLGATAGKRKAAYRRLCYAELDSEVIGDVRACVQSGAPLGNDRFRSQIERALGVKVGYRRRGRPKKVAEKRVTGGAQKKVDRVKVIGPLLSVVGRVEWFETGTHFAMSPDELDVEDPNRVDCP